jgi:hypothetical protein
VSLGRANTPFGNFEVNHETASSVASGEVPSLFMIFKVVFLPRHKKAR